MNENVRKENERKKECLKAYQQSKKELVRITEQIEELRTLRMFPHSNLSSEGGGSGELNDLSKYAADLDELERKYIESMKKQYDVLNRIQEAIEKLSKEELKQVMFYKYIKGMKWEEVLSHVGYSWTSVHRLHSKALIEIEI